MNSRKNNPNSNFQAQLRRAYSSYDLDPVSELLVSKAIERGRRKRRRAQTLLAVSTVAVLAFGSAAAGSALNGIGDEPPGQAADLATQPPASEDGYELPLLYRDVYAAGFQRAAFALELTEDALVISGAGEDREGLLGAVVTRAAEMQVPVRFNTVVTQPMNDEGVLTFDEFITQNASEISSGFGEFSVDHVQSAGITTIWRERPDSDWDDALEAKANGLGIELQLLTSTWSGAESADLRVELDRRARDSALGEVVVAEVEHTPVGAVVHVRGDVDAARSALSDVRGVLRVEEERPLRGPSYAPSGPIDAGAQGS
ncbi:hypothetical protein ACOACO_10580 [Nocardioides sp. CPCC 205120]|uniref:hypothetical protein n=1 Tax=Nocardioides sp. CPCC 205120 TaxID=3406462 RepID=UPI003B50DCE2